MKHQNMSCYDFRAHSILPNLFYYNDVVECIRVERAIKMQMNLAKSSKINFLRANEIVLHEHYFTKIIVRSSLDSRTHFHVKLD